MTVRRATRMRQRASPRVGECSESAGMSIDPRSRQLIAESLGGLQDIVAVRQLLARPIRMREHSPRTECRGPSSGRLGCAPIRENAFWQNFEAGGVANPLRRRLGEKLAPDSLPSRDFAVLTWA